MPSKRIAGTVLLLVAFAAKRADAAPQISSGLTTGAALTDMRADNGPRLAYYLGGRVDVLFLRERANTMALGPYLEIASTAFDTFESGGGLEWLIPAGDTAFILSAGAFARTSRFGFEGGAAGPLFWGSRSYNYHSVYSIGAGLFLQGRYGCGDGRLADGVLGVLVELEYMALPFVFAYQAITR
jgi:hypothetical protein